MKRSPTELHKQVRNILAAGLEALADTIEPAHVPPDSVAGKPCGKEWCAKTYGPNAPHHYSPDHPARR